MSHLYLTVPAIIVVYSAFTNGRKPLWLVQVYGSNCSKRAMTTDDDFKFLPNSLLINAHALLSAITTPDTRIPDSMDSKIHIFNQLVQPYRYYRSVVSLMSGIAVIQEHNGTENERTGKKDIDQICHHVLLTTFGQKSIWCYLCKLIDNENGYKYTCYSCTVCKVGYDVSFFSFFTDNVCFDVLAPISLHLHFVLAKVLFSRGGERDETPLPQLILPLQCHSTLSNYPNLCFFEFYICLVRIRPCLSNCSDHTVWKSNASLRIQMSVSIVATPSIGSKAKCFTTNLILLFSLHFVHNIYINTRSILGPMTRCSNTWSHATSNISTFTIFEMPSYSTVLKGLSLWAVVLLWTDCNKFWNVMRFVALFLEILTLSLQSLHTQLHNWLAI